MRHLCDEVTPLDGEWELFYVPNSRLLRDGYLRRGDASLSTPALSTSDALRQTGYSRIPVQVPYNFEWALYRAGKTDAPFLGTNILRLQELEGMHQFVCRRFAWNSGTDGVLLVFEGIDTAAEIFLNGDPLLICDNMFLEYSAEAEGLLREGENELTVHIKPAAIYARQFAQADMTFAEPYQYEGLHLRKAASSFGWDIMPRTPCGGIWRSVSLVRKPGNRISDLFGYTLCADAGAGTARLAFSFALELQTDLVRDWTLTVEGTCGESRFSCGGRIRHTCGRLTVDLPNARLWMPRNYGEPWLYEVRAELRFRRELADAATFRLGIRTVELERSSVILADGNGEFAFRINGRRIFALGTNWVPADAFHSRDRERLPDLLPLLNDLGCNMVRCWGGNVYEHEDFFDFCDENGILIWQDFAMGCGVYPQDPEFQESIRREAEQIVRKYRNHPSLALWAGDNECDLACNWSGIRRDPNRNLLTRRVLPDVLSRLDLTRPYLPSSPYLDETAYQTGLPPAEDHVWGPRDHFKGAYYREAGCAFASETGYHGCPEPSSLRRFLTPGKLWGWRAAPGSETASDEWLVHAACMEASADCQYAYRIPLMAAQVRALFREEPEELDAFAAESQISQAEAVKFFIERFRIASPRRGGILWWNLADGWPQISDAAVDYYGRKKLAYFYIRRSQAPVVLICGEPEHGELPLYAVSDLQTPVPLTCRVRELTGGTVLWNGRAEVQANSVLRLAGLPYREGEQCFYFLEWEYRPGDEAVLGSNHFVSGLEKPVRLEAYLEWMREAGYSPELFLTRGNDSAERN